MAKANNSASRRPCGRGTCYHVHDGHEWSQCWRQQRLQPDQDAIVESQVVRQPDQARLATGTSLPHIDHTGLQDSIMAGLSEKYRISYDQQISAQSSRTVSAATSWSSDQDSMIKKPTKAHKVLVHAASCSTISSEATRVDEIGRGRQNPPIDKDYTNHIANAVQLEAYRNVFPLPSIGGSRRLKRVRFEALTFYRRLMIAVLVINVSVIAAMIARSTGHTFTYSEAATAVGANLLVAVLMRQEHVINLLFHLACALPSRTPLFVRRIVAKMAYNNGGVHSGSAISAFLWYIVYTTLLVRQFHSSNGMSKAVLAIAGVIVIVLAILILLAHPATRRKCHDIWELSHRFGGWTAVGLVWTQILLVATASSHNANRPLSGIMLHLPSFWFLIIITCCLIYPWLRLKRLPVHATKLSDHATQLRFYDRRLPTCRGIRLAHNPLLECHGFATIPNAPNTPLDKDSAEVEKGYSVVISRAGDFTTDMIQHPPKHIWLRGAPTIGVMRLTSLFRPIVVVATGSGIGPCLSFLNVHRSHPMRIIWSARWPEKTYGKEIVENVLLADSNALIIDTKKTGTPDLVALAWACVRERRAEAVMIISNPRVTKEVVFGMEARGCPAFGAIFDS